MIEFLAAHLPPIQVLQIIVFGPSIAIALAGIAGIIGIAIILSRPVED